MKYYTHLNTHLNDQTYGQFPLTFSALTSMRLFEEVTMISTGENSLASTVNRYMFPTVWILP